MKEQTLGEITMKNIATFFSAFFFVSMVFSQIMYQPEFIPVTGNSQTSSAAAIDHSKTTPSDFSHVVFGDGLELSITSQPLGNASYISSSPDEITFFSLTQKFGSLGFLAHNYLAGENFYDLGDGDELELILADGSSMRYQISRVHEFQAVRPMSVESDFIDLKSGETISARELFLSMYGSAGHLTLQTCLERDGNQEWGRRFVIAVPVETA